MTTEDLFASGDYLLHIDCFDALPTTSGCQPQELACNQVGAWFIDANSCHSSDGRGYSLWSIYGRAGDVLNLEMRSDSMHPLFGVYRENVLLKTSTNDGSFGAKMRFTVPSTGWYEVLTTTRSAGEAGFYYLENRCTSSGCLFPYFTAPVPIVLKGAGGMGPSVTLPLSYYGDPLTVSVINWNDPFTTPLTFMSKAFQLPSVSEPSRFYYRVANACGDDESEVFFVLPENPAKRRTVRK